MKLAADDSYFLDAIRSAPDDDTPRLVYADVLQGRGSPWGELIVIQCELARRRTAGEARTEELARLLKREAALLVTATRWWSEDLGYPEVESFTRGMPSDVVFASASELAAASGALAHFPELAMIRVDLQEGEVLRLFTLDHLPTRGLMLRPQPTPPPGYMFDARDAGVLVKWLAKAAPALETFHVDGDIEQVALARLLRSDELSHLRRLAVTLARLIGNEVGNVYGPDPFAHARARPKEVVLDASTIGGFAHDGYEALTGLEHLSARSAHTYDWSFVPLIARANGLRSLAVGGIPLVGLTAHLLQRSEPGRLEHLDIAGSGLDPNLVADLVRHFTGLRSLDVSDHPLDDDAVIALLANRSIRRLELASCPIGPAPLTALGGRIESLGLRRTNVGDRGAEILASSPAFATLEMLELSQVGMTEAGARALAASTTLPPTCKIIVSAKEAGAALPALEERFAIVFAP